MRFNVNIRVRGLGGVTAVVRTGWMMRPAACQRFRAPCPDRDAVLPEAYDPPILPPDENGDTDWELPWTWANLAGHQAARTCIPTPMYIVGGEVISEGECGTALVRVQEATAQQRVGRALRSVVLAPAAQLDRSVARRATAERLIRSPCCRNLVARSSGMRWTTSRLHLNNTTVYAT